MATAWYKQSHHLGHISPSATAFASQSNSYWLGAQLTRQAQQMNVNKLSWPSILGLLVMTHSAAWLILVEDWPPSKAYGVLMAICIGLMITTLLFGLALVGKGNRLEFFNDAANALRKDLSNVFGKSKHES